ncbi:MAG: hypothetical protein NC935_08575 [Candidatus Omnitrophica bacterium]|nr:hypothetical protein [Candidatus Omnitrophota bacterium]
MKRFFKKNSLSLIEVVISSGIIITIFFLVYNWYFSTTNLTETTKIKTELQAKARYAMQFMINELKNTTRTSTQNPSPNLVIPSKPNNKSVHFYLPKKDSKGDINLTDDNNIEWDSDNQIKYEYIPGQKILRRLEKGNQKILANYVTDVQFIDHNIESSLALNEVKIILTLSKETKKNRNVELTLTGIVNLRN